MSDTEQAQPETSAAGAGWGCLGLVAIVLAIQIWNAIFGGYSPGTKYVIAFDSNGFSNAEARESYIESSKLGDEFGVGQLSASGQLAFLSTGSDALVLDRKYRPLMLLDHLTDPHAKRSAWLVQVRILSGLHVGEKFWVESAALANRPARAKQGLAQPERSERTLPEDETVPSEPLAELDYSARQRELLKSILDADPSPNEVKAQAWDSFLAAKDSASFRAGFDALPLDNLTKRQIYYLKFPQSYKAAPPDKRDIGGNRDLLKFLGVQEDTRPKSGLSTDPSTREYAALRAAEPPKPKDAQPVAAAPPAVDPAYIEFDKKYRLSLPDLATRPIPIGLGGDSPDVGTGRPRRVR